MSAKKETGPLSDVVDHDIPGHDGLASIGLGRLNTLLAQTLDRFAQHIDGFGRSVALPSILDQFFDFACHYQNVCHFSSQDESALCTAIEMYLTDLVQSIVFLI
jgi:hypothetical protein